MEAGTGQQTVIVRRIDARSASGEQAAGRPRRVAGRRPGVPSRAARPAAGLLLL